MDRTGGQGILFEEHQSAARTWWPWLLIPTGLYLLVWFGYGLYAQLVLGRPFGRPALSDGWLIALSLAMFALGGALIWGALKIRLSVVVDGRGLFLIFFPFARRLFRPGDILSARAVSFRPLLDYGGWGLRWSFKDRSRCYTMSGNRGVRLELAAAKPVLIGSQKAEELVRALDRLTS